MKTNDFCAVFGASDPHTALKTLGQPITYWDAEIAFAGAPVWKDSTGTFFVSGEIALDNAPELRHLLSLPRAQDGELLAELFRIYGPQAAKHALGMYALAVWDTQTKRLILVRDAAGARTLYHATDGRIWWCAARLNTLRRCPAVSRSINLAALRDYLICSFVPGTQTLWQDVQELRPGTTVTLPGGETRTYWRPSEPIDKGEPPSEPQHAQLRTLLEDAVRRRLPPSGSTAVFLSGGLDSSLVTALAARDAPGPVHTFAVHFGDRFPNELLFSSMVAEHCRTQHHVIELPAKRIQKMLFETIAALDDPIGDPLTTPNLLLGRAAADVSGIVLNGEGGDPCFGGPKNAPMMLHELYGQGEERESAYLRSFQKCYDDLPRLLTAETKSALRDLPPPEAAIAPFFAEPGREYLDRLMHLNVCLKGSDQILTKVNNLTAANGLLGRSPLFDRRIVEMSFCIPPEYKRSGAEEKAILKAAVSDLLPRAILDRPKSGMLVPVQAWFQRDLRRFARALLLSRRARTRPYLNPETVRQWLDYEGSALPRHGVKLWLLLTLEIWLQVNG